MAGCENTPCEDRAEYVESNLGVLRLTINSRAAAEACEVLVAYQAQGRPE